MSGQLTRLEMRTEVLDNLTQNADMVTANDVTLAVMAERWLDRSQVRISRMYNLIWREQISATVIGQKAYSFDQALRSIVTIRLEDGMNSRKLTLVMPTKFDLEYPKPDEYATGRPTIYIPFGNTNTFELFKIPDAEYVLRLRGCFFPTSLTTDSQKSDYTFLDDVIVAYATMYGYQWLQEMNDAKFWKSIGNDELKAQINSEVSKFPDWVSQREGFTVSGNSYLGEYYNDPFVLRDNGMYLV